ncbi:MAG: hypothetical protein DRI23_03155 [Candidatus Cloacimonadota bacterium]|nr:MAG: hypothetical protein DRI23_03155 [Candidatus Cloacimonadota bacterium]
MLVKNILRYISFFLISITINIFATNLKEGIELSQDSILIDYSIEDSLGITANEVINNYLEAIGGRDLFAEVEDRTTIMRGTAMGQNLTILVKQKVPAKLYQEIKVGEITQTVYFDGERGMMVTGDNTIEIEKKELEKLEIEATMDLLLDPESYGLIISLTGVELVDSIDCYVVKMVLPSGLRWQQYYSIETGFKLKEIKELHTQQGLFEQESFYSDYRNVDGLKLYKTWECKNWNLLLVA